MKTTDRLVTLGKEQLEDGHYDNALNSFEQAILLNQSDPDLWNLKAKLILAQIHDKIHTK